MFQTVLLYRRFHDRGDRELEEAIAAIELDREAIASSIASGFKKCAEASEAVEVVQNTEKLPEHCLKSAQCFACYRNV
mgnify:CR=1 FL=1